MTQQKTSITLEEAVALVTNAIANCLTASGKQSTEITMDEAPLAAIAGFDSLCGLEVTIELEQQLGAQLDENVFVRTVGSRSRPRTLREVCKAILAVAK